jgi:hypothetical protein
MCDPVRLDERFGSLRVLGVVRRDDECRVKTFCESCGSHFVVSRELLTSGRATSCRWCAAEQLYKVPASYRPTGDVDVPFANVIH